MRRSWQAGSEFVGTLSKGAHVAIEGQLRSHEYQCEVAWAPRRPRSRSASGKSASTPCSNSIEPSNVNRMMRGTRGCPLRGISKPRSIKVYTQPLTSIRTDVARVFDCTSAGIRRRPDEGVCCIEF
jgi:hypothetical protein